MAEFVDGFGIHPYGWANPTNSRVSAPAEFVPSHNNHPSFFYLDTLENYRQILLNNGLDPDLQPFWATEFGWPTVAGFDAPPPLGAEFFDNVNLEQQARYTLDALAFAAEVPWLKTQILWNLNFAPRLALNFLNLPTLSSIWKGSRDQFIDQLKALFSKNNQFRNNRTIWKSQLRRRSHHLSLLTHLYPFSRDVSLISIANVDHQRKITSVATKISMVYVTSSLRPLPFAPFRFLPHPT